MRGLRPDAFEGDAWRDVAGRPRARAERMPKTGRALRHYKINCGYAVPRDRPGVEQSVRPLTIPTFLF